MEMVALTKYEEYVSKYGITYSPYQLNFDDDFPKNNLFDRMWEDGEMFGIFELRKLSEHDCYRKDYKNGRFRTRYHRVAPQENCIMGYSIVGGREVDIDLLNSAGIDIIIETDNDFIFPLGNVTRNIYGIYQDLTTGFELDGIEVEHTDDGIIRWAILNGKRTSSRFNDETRKLRLIEYRESL